VTLKALEPSPSRKEEIPVTLLQWQMQALNPVEINGNFFISFHWREIWVMPIFPLICHEDSRNK